MAKAALIALNFETEEIKITIIEKDENNLNPVAACHDLKREIEDDWLGYVWTVVCDVEAQELMVAAKMKALGFLRNKL